MSVGPLRAFRWRTGTSVRVSSTLNASLPLLPAGVEWHEEVLSAGARLAVPVHAQTGLGVTGVGCFVIGPGGEVLKIHSALTRNRDALRDFCIERYEGGVAVSPDHVTGRLRELAGLGNGNRPAAEQLPDDQ